ncbi:MAG: hypothetical protein ACI9X4_000240 [Glaciecola sp.]|jgi:hypothetical protein
MSQSKKFDQFDPSTLSRLMVAVQNPDGKEHLGTLVHFTGGTLTVQFWGDKRPSYGLTQPLSIFIKGLNIDLPALPGCAMERNELPGGRTYRFAYTLTPEFQEQIPEELWVLFPSRASHRVKPSEGAPVVASLSRLEGGEQYPATVVDISTSGVGLAVDRATEAQLHSQSAIRLHFTFPTLSESENTTIIFGKVMHRRIAGSVLSYGVSFDVELALETVGHDALIRYIVEQER